MTKKEQYTRLEEIKEKISDAGVNKSGLLNEALGIPCDFKGESLLMEVIVHFTVTTEFSSDVAAQIFGLLPRMQEHLKKVEDSSSMDEIYVLMTHIRALTFLPGLDLKKEIILQFLQEVITFFDSYGFSGQSRLFQNMRGIMLDIGDYEGAAHYHREYQNSGDPSKYHCGQCYRYIEKDFDYLVTTGQDEEAWEMWQNLKTKAGKGCTIPDLRLGHLAHPELFLLNRKKSKSTGLTDAWARIERGINELGKVNFGELRSSDRKIKFAIIQKERKKAIQFFQESFLWHLGKSMLIPRFLFFCDALLLFRILQMTGRKYINLQLPKSFCLYRNSEKYTIKLLIQWFEKESQIMAQKIDNRNGNDLYTQKLQRLSLWGKSEFWDPIIPNKLDAYSFENQNAFG